MIEALTGLEGRRAAWPLLLCLLGSFQVSAQGGALPSAAGVRASTWPPKALSDVEVSSRATRSADRRVFSYALTIANPSSNVLPVDFVEVDVSVPPGRTAPNDFVPGPDATFDDPFRPFRKGPAAPGGYDRPVDFMRRVAGQDLLRVGLSSPPGWHSWLSLSPPESPIGLRPVAGWGHETYAGPTEGIRPGASMSGFRIESSLPPGIRVVLLRPSFDDLEALYNIPHEWRTSSEDSDTEIEEKDRRIAKLSSTAVTLAPTPPPGWGLVSIAEGIVALVDEAGAAGWHPDPSVATGLRHDAESLVALANARNRDELLAAITAFAAKVRALPASRIRPEAADLFALNADFLADRVEHGLPPPPPSR